MGAVPYVTVNSQKIHYTDAGQGPVVIATHATLMDTVSLEPLTDRVIAAGFRVIAFDLRGHGQTVYDQQPYSFEDVAADVIGLADELGIDRFALLAEGQGAVVSLRTALLAPERVVALALIGPTADAASESENAALSATMDIWCTVGPDPFLYRIVADSASASPAEGEKLLARWQASAWRDYRPAADALANRSRFVDQLPAITCPALIVHGSGDFYVPQELGMQVAENLGGPAEFVSVPTENQAITVAFDPRVADIIVARLPALFAASDRAE